jgi:hypothetical protein
MGADILILLLPIVMVWNIRFTGNERLGIVLIFTLGSSYVRGRLSFERQIINIETESASLVSFDLRSKWYNITTQTIRGLRQYFYR